VWERLRKIPKLPARDWIVFLGQQTQVIAHIQLSIKEIQGVVTPTQHNQTIHEPEAAQEKGRFVSCNDAIQRESYAIETMYRDFAQQAFTAGDKAVGDRFEEIRHDEIKHRDAFKKVLEKLAKKPLRAW
jgi:rubrerythrin